MDARTVGRASFQSLGGNVGRACGGTAHDTQGAGETYPVGVEVGGLGGFGYQDGDGVVRGQPGPDLLVGQLGQPGAQHFAGSAQVGFELVVAGLVFPAPVVDIGQFVVAGVGLDDGGDQGDQLAGAVAFAAFYRRWRVVAWDGTTLDVPDTEVNVAEFGRPGSSRGLGKGAFPQVRVAALAECGTHVVFAAAMGPLAGHESTLVRQLLPCLGSGMLLIADRGLLGFELWTEAAATGADLLWRVKANMVLPVDVLLPDGSYLSHIAASSDRQKVRPVTVRAIEYTLPGSSEVYRLITTIGDPQQAPAAELAALYHERWEIESTLDELKTHQRGPGMVLRSRHPDGVRQEVYGFLLVHYTIRELMWQAAAHDGIDPDRISFTRTINLIRRQATAQAAFSPQQTGPSVH